MDIKVSTTELYELIRGYSDKETAEKVVAALNQSIKDEVSKESVSQIKDLKIDLIDRINSAKLQTIMWVVGMGVFQLLARYIFQ